MVNKDTEFDFEISAKINDNVEFKDKDGLPTHRFTNRVKIIADGEEKAETKQTQEITKDEDYNVISKSSKDLENNIIEYGLVINPDAKKLVEDRKSTRLNSSH